MEGGNAPDLTIEELWKITRILKRKGVRRVVELRLDASRTPDPKEQSGIRAYEGPSGALSANFNALTFSICPGKLGHEAKVTTYPSELNIEVNGKILTTQAETPEAPSVKPVFEDSKDSKLSLVLGGSINLHAPCQLHSRSVNDPLLYLKMLFVAMLKNADIEVERVSYSKTPEELPLFYSHESKPLRQIIDDLNHFSTNFVAEEILGNGH